MTIPMTPEERAVDIYLSDETRQYSMGGCGCMGPQPINSDDYGKDERFSFVITQCDRIKTVKVLRESFYRYLSVKEALNWIDNKHVFDQYWSEEGRDAAADKFLVNEGTVIEKFGTAIKKKPYCGCMMKETVEVDGHYYDIINKRVGNAIIYEAVNIGPLGGPYNRTRE
jgi:hypothetical protein